MHSYHIGTVRRSMAARGLWLLCTSALCCHATAALAQSSPATTSTNETREQVDPSGGEIMVTARRQAETAITVPQSITAFGEESLIRLGIQSFDDYATKVPNLAFSYGSNGYGFVGSKTIAIRGISGAGTTAYYIDDTPIPEDLDPQVVDIQRIEVLKGPQGTLFGQGSLGGNIRLITNRPSLNDNEMRFSAEAGVTKNGGSADYMANGVSNMVIVPDKIGLRVVGFVNHEAGFYDRIYPGQNGSVLSGPVLRQGDQGAKTSYGGSMSLRLAVTEEFTADLRIMGQDQKYKGYPAIDAPLPGFKPRALEQVFFADVQDEVRDSWFLPSLELTYASDAVTVTSSTSYFRRKSGVTEEGTEQTNALFPLFYDIPGQPPVPRFNAASPNVWFTDDKNTTFNQEVRASFKGNDWISGVVGARYGEETSSSFLKSTELPGLAASGYWPNDIYAAFASKTIQKDISVFGEAYLSYAGFELTLGLRKYWLRQHTPFSIAEGFSFGGTAASYNLRARASGLNPKVALAYKFANEGLIYASASKGFRAGGPLGPLSNPCLPGLASIGLTPADLAQLDPDTVWNYEIGGKKRIGRITATAAVFQMDWDNIQQSVILPQCQVPRQVNAGAARSRGVELELAGQLFQGFDARIGFGYNNAKITDSGRLNARPVGSRLFNIPKFTVSVAGDYNWALTDGLDAFIGADYSFVDKSLSGVVEAQRPSYQIVNARLGIRRGEMEIGLFARNLFDERANLGDLSNLSFGKFDTDGNIIPRVVVLHPRQLGVSFRHSF
jgi:iron complex outermembrane recepter protein